MHKEVIKDKFYRIIATRRPSIDLFEDLVDESKFNILFDIESRTNSRIREEHFQSIIPKEEQYVGNNPSLVNAPFLHCSKDLQSRFSNGTFGIFYCAKEEECAIAETKYHTLKFLQSTNEGETIQQKRLLNGDFCGNLTNIKNINNAQIYDTDDYSYSQSFGLQEKEQSSDGIAYDSVRYKNGTCYAILKPCVIKNIREIKCYNYIFKDNKITVEEIKC